jgi:hypothetical protein
MNNKEKLKKLMCEYKETSDVLCRSLESFLTATSTEKVEVNNKKISDTAGAEISQGTE